MNGRNKHTHYQEAFRVILVDDDEDYREAICGELVDHGFSVRGIGDSDGLLEFFRQGGIGDIIVMDWRLPGTSGLDLLTELRRLGINLPAIFLTGLTDVAYESKALDHGALDFVGKSRGGAILARRIRLVLGPAQPEAGRHRSEGDIQHGALTLRRQGSRALWRGRDVGLTVVEYNIVALLLQSMGEYVTYRAIYDRVHHAGFMAGTGDDGYRTNVRSAIKRIRKKFRAVDPDFSQMENFAAFGYRWLEEAVEDTYDSPASDHGEAGEADSGGGPD